MEIVNLLFNNLIFEVTKYDLNTRTVSPSSVLVLLVAIFRFSRAASMKLLKIQNIQMNSPQRSSKTRNVVYLDDSLAIVQKAFTDSSRFMTMKLMT